MIKLKRKHEIRQNDALNQIALVNSDNNEVTIINNPKDYVSTLIQKGKLEQAADVISEICKQAEMLHPLYPLYVYKPVDFGGRTVFFHSPSTPEIAKVYPLQFKGEFKIVDSDIRKGENIKDFLSRKYYSQQKVSIDITYIEAWIGEQIIKDDYSFEQHAFKDGEWHISPENLPDSIKTKLIVTAEREHVLIDYLELNITEYDKIQDNLVISNLLQEGSPLVVSLTLRFSMLEERKTENKVNFNIHIREEHKGNIKAEKTFLEFVNLSSKDVGISFIDLEESKPIFSAKSINVSGGNEVNYLEEKLDFLSDLLLIEEKFDVKFKLPSAVSEEDLENVSIIKSIIMDEDVTGTIKEFSVLIDEKNTLNKIVNDVKTETLMITCERDLSFVLFGAKFNPIKAYYQFTNLSIKNLELIKKKLTYFQSGEVIKVEFKTDSKDNVLTTYKY